VYIASLNNETRLDASHGVKQHCITVRISLTRQILHFRVYSSTVTVLNDALYQCAIANNLAVISDSMKMLLWYGRLELTLVCQYSPLIIIMPLPPRGIM